jgi:hypothetical protein
MIGQDDPISMIRALDKIRKTASQKDYQLVIEILRDSAIFKGGGGLIAISLKHALN